MLYAEDKKQQSHLKVLAQIQKSSLYELEELQLGFAKVRFNLDNAQTIDDGKTVFEGEIYKIANFSALVAVNEENTFVISSHVDFLSQVEVSSGEIVFEARSTSSSLGKRFVEVKAKINDIDVFWGDFTVLKMDNRSNIKM